MFEFFGKFARPDVLIINKLTEDYFYKFPKENIEIGLDVITLSKINLKNEVF
jgi:hypothetical protein